jgi:Zinc dependent phospholipase C
MHCVYQAHFNQVGEKLLLSSIQMLTRRRFKLFSVSVPIVLGLIFGTCCAPKCSGYSVLTDEAIIDAAWKESIVPVLLKRFPNATPEELLQAHVYAYGGAIIQDMGYYPFGNSFFSDLTHYVRTGEFVLALIEESRNLNEYAFALIVLGEVQPSPLDIRLMRRNMVSKFLCDGSNRDATVP